MSAMVCRSFTWIGSRDPTQVGLHSEHFYSLSPGQHFFLNLFLSFPHCVQLCVFTDEHVRVECRCWWRPEASDPLELELQNRLCAP